MRMRSVVVLVVLLFCSILWARDIDEISFGTAVSFEAVTWNTEWFPLNGETTINYVSQIVEALDVDFLAFQEIDNFSSFAQMIEDLTNFDGYYVDSEYSGLAFIYKPNTVTISEIYEIYTTQSYWRPFPRSPLVVELQFMNENFILINNHFKCCGDGYIDWGDNWDEEKRRYDASVLLKEYIDENFPNENVIVLGDLNDEITDASSDNVFQPFFDDDANYRFADMEVAEGSSADWSYPTWPSHIDHILVTNELFDELENATIETIKIDEFMSGGWNQYENNISDHRPVALKIEFNNTIYGDVDGNGEVQAYDASLVLQNVIELIDFNENQIFTADVDGNGQIQAYDASLILQYIVGIIDEFPLE